MLTCGLCLSLTHDLHVAVHASEFSHLLPSWGNRRQMNTRYCRSILQYLIIFTTQHNEFYRNVLMASQVIQGGRHERTVTYYILHTTSLALAYAKASEGTI
jgi:hypothetical protein